jgi:hypothetical protein
MSLQTHRHNSIKNGGFTRNMLGEQSDSNSLDFIERNLIAPAVIEPRRPG